MGKASRTAARTGTRRRRSARGWWIVAPVVLAAAAGVGWWASSAHTQSTPRAQPAPELGEQLPSEGYTHVDVGTPIIYRDHPPASGPHYPTPAATRVYPGLAPGFWVHSLEHGYIVLLYKPPASAHDLAQFDKMVAEFPPSKYGNVKLVIAPYPDMDHRFAVLAWTSRLFLDTLDREKILAFYRAHVDKGREDLP